MNENTTKDMLEIFLRDLKDVPEDTRQIMMIYYLARIDASLELIGSFIKEIHDEQEHK